jgi:hypothetical protein
MSKIAISGASTGSATFTIESPATSTNRTLTLPDNTGTIITQNSTPAFASTIGVGGATAAASGAGITFPATVSASSNANTLDDYEEGTWTPVYFGATTAGTTTYTGQRGLYLKIGKTVYCECDLAWSAKTGTGDGLIGGLPFTVDAYATDARALFYIAGYGGYSVTGVLAGIVQGNNTYIIVYAINNGSLAGSTMQNSGEVRFQFYYIAA